MQRRRLKQTSPLETRLCEEAAHLRKQAQGTHPGVERERLLQKARQAEVAAQMSDWLQSPGLQPPK